MENLKLRINRMACVRRKPHGAIGFFTGTEPLKEVLVPNEELDQFAQMYPEDYLLRLAFIQDALRKPTWACLLHTKTCNALAVCRSDEGRSVIAIIEKRDGMLHLHLTSECAPIIYTEE